ncbi:MAG: hypothetical protein WCT46_06775 [Candidatus Gracilibacteria bacterium]
MEKNEITVQCGANNQPVQLVENEELTVGDVRDRLADVLNIAPTALAVIGDETVDDDRVLVAGETLQFIKQSGSKG